MAALAGNKPNSKRAKKSPSTLPADYSDVLSQIATLRSLAATPDLQNRGYIRQKQAGKLWVRERIDQLLDPGTFREEGSISGTVKWKQTGPLAETPVAFTPTNNLQGLDQLRGRTIVLTADNFSIRGGHADGAIAEKTMYMEKMAVAMKLPIIKLVGWEFRLRERDGDQKVGMVIGLGAARVVSCHFSVMAADVGALFNAGPKVVEGATFEEGLDFQDLGGPMMHCTNGTIDNLAANEAECFEQLRTVLGYLPNSGSEAPPTVPCNDPEDREDIGLRTIIPRKQTRMYNPRTIITSVVDRGSWFEIGALWGTTSITGFARLGGRPIGIESSNCEVKSGALDVAGSQKLTSFLKLCDVMNLPLVQFVDVPGYAIGTVAERTATMRWGVELGKTYFSTTMPIFSVITRRVFGVAGGIMVGCRDPAMQCAWPSGQWGSLPLDGGIEVGHRHELREAEKAGRKAERYKELEEEYLRLMNPVRTANAFGVEEIIDPKDTRSICCAWIKRVYDAIIPERLSDRTNGRIQPSFF
ncbi:propionyl-CoA carboxylase [Histoplasma capsulatum G186AR]|uniref:Propionyl-CoA carboxylase n=2 Tax=Ajellomyces capsulatus TaxID=5037 RepID=C0NSM3_AJECG|nr:propionyl-CoA carboxylase [Histoplasma capsulatum G186AR]EEH05889.1 propionyl-CoA carboxylase [Histoplasma capsulatum G186AR]